MIFWDTILPVGDSFWNQHKPGDRWGCQCSIEATDDPATERPISGPQDDPAPGIDNNPAQDGQLFSDSHPYFPQDCAHCTFNKRGLKNRYKGFFMSDQKNQKDCFNCQYIKDCIEGPEIIKKEVENYLKIAKSKIDIYNSVDVIDTCFASGSMKILRRSLQDVYEHARYDNILLEWLSTFDLTKINKWNYEGWANNKPYGPNHPKYDPQKPTKEKHTESKYFLFYSLFIGGEKYYANVIMHKNYDCEILYTIERVPPSEIIQGIPPEIKKEGMR